MRIIKKILKFPLNVYKIASKATSGKWSRFLICLDYIYCRLRFHASSSEYLHYQLYNYKDRYRKNFLLRYHQKNEFPKINQLLFTKSKYNFYKRIPDCFSRELILAPECGEDAFIQFAKKHKKIVTKPDTGTCGRDIRVFIYTDDKQAQEYFSQLSEPTVCEEYICQHEKLTNMSPFSVNTVRIVSFRENDNIEIISATLKTGGQVGVIMDNMQQNGVGAQVDVNTGTIFTYGFDYDNNLYKNHPLSGVQFLGFDIPNWDKAIELVKTAHMQLPQCQLLGWDIAITQIGADIIEANNRPGPPLMQMAWPIPRGEKILKATRKAKKKKLPKRNKYSSFPQ